MVGTVHTVRYFTHPTLPPVLSVRSNRTDSRNGMYAVRTLEALFVHRKKLKNERREYSKIDCEQNLKNLSAKAIEKLSTQKTFFDI